MLTEGFWGIRYRKIDKITIIENSIPEIIGDKISKFCKIHKYQYELENLYNRINLVNPLDDCELEEIEKVRNLIPNAKGKYWGDVLSQIKNDFFLFADGLKYMPDYGYLLYNSYEVEYGYIINVDTMKLEIWKGKQTIPQKTNRYGNKRYNGFYPCRMICQYSWNKITDGLIDYRDIELVYKEIERESKI